MTFYTDPSYFAKLWAEEMEKHIIENKQELKVRRKRVSILTIAMHSFMRTSYPLEKIDL